MAEFYSLLPQNGKDSAVAVSSTSKLRELRSVCENVELDQCNAKLNENQIGAYHFQLLVYLVQNELALAKYLNKRVPKDVREKASFKAIWDVGVSMWQSENAKVFAKIRNGQWPPIYKPFLERLEVNYRLKQVEAVSKAYTSITIKELLENYLGFKDIKELSKFIKTNNLNDRWTFDNNDKPQKVIINKVQENYQQLLNTQKLMAQFTKYVVFMESQQKLAIDEISAATSSKN